MGTLFKNLEKSDIQYITALYNDKTLSKKEAQKVLSDKYEVHTRTVRKWAKELELVKINRLQEMKTAFNKVKGKSNVLVIGDLHEPFCLNNYLAHCQLQYEKYNCNKVIFIGDVIDNHYSSYHETDANGMGGGDELSLAKSRIATWYNAFPKADVLIGNHDRIIMRKAQTSSIPREWIRSYSEVLGAPKWNFVDRVVVDNVQYIHGEAGTARTKCRADMMSTVQGHLHTQCYTEWYVGANFKIFGTQVGCGIDHDSYAMGYAKRGKKPAIGCVVVIAGEVVINCLMKL